MVWDGWEDVYIRNAILQSRQNERFLRFVFKILKESEYNFKRVCEFGVGDCEVAKVFDKVIGREGIIYLVDRSLRFLEECGNVVGRGRIIHKDFREIAKEDFSEGLPEIVISSNSFHWLKKDEWLEFMRRLYEILSDDGYLIFHQGLKRSYVFLYDFANELFEREYGIRVNWEKRLFYPWYGELIQIMKELGFRVVRTERFVEEYDVLEAIRSFSVAGLNVFLEQIEGEEERLRFRRIFIEEAKKAKKEFLVFAHRGFFAFRRGLREEKEKFDLKLVEGWQIEHINQGFIKKLKKFFEEVSDDFIPSLRERGPNDFDFGRRGSVDYLDELINTGYRFIVVIEKESCAILGVIAFTEKVPYSVRFSDKALYIAVLAIRRGYRGLGFGRFLLEKVVELAKKEGYKLLETRTWETNEVMKRLLSSLGFVKTLSITGHRVDRDGRPIGTEYYVRRLEDE